MSLIIMRIRKAPRYDVSLQYSNFPFLRSKRFVLHLILFICNLFNDAFSVTQII
jgi:hypothetical protein